MIQGIERNFLPKAGNLASIGRMGLRLSFSIRTT